jgi:hypothetical protein
MNTDDFFNLPEEDQERLARNWDKRRAIKHRMDMYREREAELLQELRDIQNKCQHWIATKDYEGADSSQYLVTCPDCGSAWYEDA